MLNARILRTKVLFGSFFYLHRSRGKLPKRRLCARKTLMKLTPVVDFTNILQSAFFVRKCFVQLFSNFIQFGFVIFGRKITGANSARKMLVKTTYWSKFQGPRCPGINIKKLTAPAHPHKGNIGNCNLY